MVGRCGFVGDILYCIGVTGFIYPIIGHWAWGPDGWRVTMSNIILGAGRRIDPAVRLVRLQPKMAAISTGRGETQTGESFD
jgi:hypothetical protein